MVSQRTQRISSILSYMEINTGFLKSSAQHPQNTVEGILRKDHCVEKDREISDLREEVEFLRDQLEALAANEHELRRKEEENGLDLLEKYKSIASEKENELCRYKRWAEDRLREQLEEILELKGSIRVVCRIKPFKSEEPVEATETTVEFPKRGMCFPFSKVIFPGSEQADVFLQISDLVLSATKGYKASILAYGPTGSGKTYTVQGTPENRGVVCRIVQTLKEEFGRQRELGWEYEAKINIVELYNDKLIGQKEDEWKSVRIEEVEEEFNRAANERKTGSTNCNERSSRSHLIFQIRIKMQKKTDSRTEEIEGSLCIVDLAGSERLSHSQAEGDRMKEAVEINKSLSSLSDVVYAIFNKAQHIPYRNSKLTWLLRSSLGEGAKTAFIINIDPGSSIEETITALRFSKKLQECQLGRSTKNAVLRKTDE